MACSLFGKGLSYEKKNQGVKQHCKILNSLDHGQACLPAGSKNARKIIKNYMKNDLFCTKLAEK